MNCNLLYLQLLEAKKKGQKKFVVLLDPDKLKLTKIDRIVELAYDYGVDYFFIGGSLILNDLLDSLLSDIKNKSRIPLILFPGNYFQLSYKADALLFLSLISGRNAELLIGKHVITAPFLKVSPLEIMPTGYMLINGGVMTSVQYMSNTTPIPSDKDDIALCTAMAGEMLGLKLIYMDAGSGAAYPIPARMVKTVSESINIPLIVGGGIRTPDKAAEIASAGADVIVVGNAIEKEPMLIAEMARAIKEQSSEIPFNAHS